MSIAAALRRPFSARILPGLLFVLFPIIEFFGMGYKMFCARTAMTQNNELPEWKNWKELFIFGGLARVIQIIWLAPAAIMFLFFYLKLKALSIGTITSVESIMAVRDMIFLFVILLIVAAVFMPASVMNYVAEAKFKDAFSLSMFRRIISRNYVIGWLLSSAYILLIVGIFFALFYFAGSFLAGLPQLLTVISALFLELFLLWIPGITYWTIIGEYWGKAIYKEQLSQRQLM